MRNKDVSYRVMGRKVSCGMNGCRFVMIECLFCGDCLLQQRNECSEVYFINGGVAIPGRSKFHGCPRLHCHVYVYDVMVCGKEWGFKVKDGVGSVQLA